MINLLLNPRVIIFVGFIVSVYTLWHVHNEKVAEYKQSVINEIKVVEAETFIEVIKEQKVVQEKVVTIYRDRVISDTATVTVIKEMPLKTAADINNKYTEIMKCFEGC